MRQQVQLCRGSSASATYFISLGKWPFRIIQGNLFLVTEKQMGHHILHHRLSPKVWKTLCLKAMKIAVSDHPTVIGHLLYTDLPQLFIQTTNSQNYQSPCDTFFN